MHLGGVVEHAGQQDVIGRDHTPARVLQDVTRPEVLEIRVRAREVRELAVGAARLVGGKPKRDGYLAGRDFPVGNRRLRVALPDLDLALERQHHLTVLVAPRRLHVDDP